MWRSDFVKFKGKNPEYWGINPDKTYVVQDTRYRGNQNCISLRNASGKLRWYYEHLFEKIDLHPCFENRNPDVKRLKKAWLDSDGPESKAAYETLKAMDSDWRRNLQIRKGSIVKFIRGAEAGRFEDRKFKVISDPVGGKGLFSGAIRLAGLYGFYDVNNLDPVTD